MLFGKELTTSTFFQTSYPNSTILVGFPSFSDKDVDTEVIIAKSWIWEEQIVVEPSTIYYIPSTFSASINKDTGFNKTIQMLRDI